MYPTTYIQNDSRTSVCNCEVYIGGFAFILAFVFFFKDGCHYIVQDNLLLTLLTHTLTSQSSCLTCPRMKIICQPS